MSRYPSAILQATRESASTPSTLPSGTNTPAFDSDPIQKQLLELGFRPAHVVSCLNALSAAHDRMHRGSSSAINDPLTLSLSTLSPFEAAIEWLLVHLPEDDLPKSYRSTSNTADFISSVASDSVGKTGLVKGWLVDKLVKKAGFPRKAVELVVANEARETIVLDELGRRLCGFDGSCEGCDDQEARDAAREEEKMVLQSVLDDRIKEIDGELVIQVSHGGSDDLNMHILFSEDSCYPSAGHLHPPSFYLTSRTLPSYIKLHLHRRLLERFRDPERPDLAETLSSGMGGAVFAMVEVLEEDLPAAIESPPDVGRVTEYLQPKPDVVEPEVAQRRRIKQRQQRTARPTRPPTEAQHQQVAQWQQQMKAKPAYPAMLDARSKLPAWKEKDRVNEILAKNRVLIVVGEVRILFFCGRIWLIADHSHCLSVDRLR